MLGASAPPNTKLVALDVLQSAGRASRSAAAPCPAPRGRGRRRRRDVARLRGRTPRSCHAVPAPGRDDQGMRSRAWVGAGPRPAGRRRGPRWGQSHAARLGPAQPPRRPRVTA